VHRVEALEPLPGWQPRARRAGQGFGTCLYRTK
jgi:hypothetical protein